MNAVCLYVCVCIRKPINICPAKKEVPSTCQPAILWSFSFLHFHNPQNDAAAGAAAAGTCFVGGFYHLFSQLSTTSGVQAGAARDPGKRVFRPQGCLEGGRQITLPLRRQTVCRQAGRQAGRPAAVERPGSKNKTKSS